MKRFIIFYLLLPSFFLVNAVREGFGFTIVAGKGATEDGSVIVAHNEDNKGKQFFVNVHKIPAKPKVRLTGFLWVEVPGVEFGDSFMNEHGVVITSNSCRSREDRPMISNGGIGPKLRRLVAEQATSARHAVEIAGRLIEKYGYLSSGRSYAIADASEAWLLQVVKGKHWIAKRVPDDQVAVISNRYTIDTIDLKDKDNYRGSAGIIDYAVKRKKLLYFIKLIRIPPVLMMRTMC
jgi:dipeptidase